MLLHVIVLLIVLYSGKYLILNCDLCQRFRPVRHEEHCDIEASLENLVYREEFRTKSHIVCRRFCISGTLLFVPMQVVGQDRLPEMKDKGKLPFTEAAILETQRLGSIGEYWTLL